MDYEGDYDWMELRRGELPDGTAVVDDEQFLTALRQLGGDLEILSNPRRPGVWSVYRIKLRGASPAGDFLVHEMDLPGPPNSGWLEYIRSRAVIVPGVTPGDLDQAKKYWFREMVKHLNQKRVEVRRRKADLARLVNAEIESFVVRKRASDVTSRTRPRKHPVALREDVFRVRGGFDGG